MPTMVVKKNMIEYVLMIIAIIGSILALMQKDLVKAAVLTSIPGAALAIFFQILLASDVALTQAIVGTAIVPVFFALTAYKTKRQEEE